VSGRGMLIHAGKFNGLEVVGIVPQQERSISQLYNKVVVGSLDSLQPGKFNIVLGQSLAAKMGLVVGDKVNILTPQANVTLLGNFLRYKTFTISGIFHTSDGFGFDNTVAYINMQDAAKLFPPGQGISGLHLKLMNLYDAFNVTQSLEQILPEQYGVNNWTTQFGAFFQALQMEKTMLFVILLLIVAVAAFNLVSTLVMVVNDKRADIAILRTLGASRRTIMFTFIIQGAVVGLVGTLLGLVLGIILSLNVTALTNWIQNVFGVQFLSSSVYFINYLPSRIDPMDIVHVCLIAFGLSLLATLYPAFMAFRTQPAEALRYE
jgi:lipoprotein-releasing system permease protein